MKKQSFNTDSLNDYIKQIQELLTRLRSDFVRRESYHPDIYIPKGSSQYRETTPSRYAEQGEQRDSSYFSGFGDKLKNLIQRFSRYHTKGYARQYESTHSFG